MSQGAWILVIVVVLASAFGLWRAVRDGRFRGTHPVHGVSTGPDSTGGDSTAGDSTGADARTRDHAATQAGVLTGTDLGHALGERATLLQFSSAFCAPCRAARRVLSDVAEIVPGVTHVEIDAEHHLDLVRRLGVVRTPTTLVLDAHGRETTRATGAPRKEAVVTALGTAIGPGP